MTFIKNAWIIFLYFGLAVIPYFSNINEGNIFFVYYKSIIKAAAIIVITGFFVFMFVKTEFIDNSIKLNKKIIIATLIFWTLINGILINLLHKSFYYSAFDIAYFDNIYWNFFRGDYFYSSMLNMNSLAHHFSPIMIINGIIYKIFPVPLTAMFFVRTFFLSLGGLAVYKICLEKKLSDISSFIIFLIYFIFPATAYYTLDVFHPEDYVIVCFLWAYLMLLKDKLLSAFILFLIAAYSKEDAAPAIFILYLILFFEKKNKKLLYSAIFFVIFFAVVFAVIIPIIRPADFSPFWLHRYSEFGGSLGGIVKTAIYHPALILKKFFIIENIAYFTFLFAPLLFFPLVSIKYLLPFFPAFLFNLLANYSPQKQIMNCYQYIFIAVVWIALIDATVKIESLRRVKMLLAILAACAAAGFLWGPFPYARTFYLTKKNPYICDKSYIAAKKLIAKIPEDSIVSSTEKILPHLSHHRKIQWSGLQLKYPENFQSGYCEKPDFYLLDISFVDSLHFSVENKVKYVELISSILTDSQYSVKEESGNWILLKKN